MIGILILVAAVVVAVLNLKRVANLGMMWLSPPLLDLGVALAGDWGREEVRVAVGVTKANSLYNGPMRILNFNVVMTPDSTGGYVVTCPALPGLVTEGDTLEEARAMATDAIQGYLERSQERWRAATD